MVTSFDSVSKHPPPPEVTPQPHSSHCAKQTPTLKKAVPVHEELKPGRRQLLQQKPKEPICYRTVTEDKIPALQWSRNRSRSTNAEPRQTAGGSTPAVAFLTPTEVLLKWQLSMRRQKRGLWAKRFSEGPFVFLFVVEATCKIPSLKICL